jgi:hypothetical protein
MDRQSIRSFAFSDVCNSVTTFRVTTRGGAATGRPCGGFAAGSLIHRKV